MVEKMNRLRQSLADVIEQTQSLTDPQVVAISNQLDALIVQWVRQQAGESTIDR